MLQFISIINYNSLQEKNLTMLHEVICLIKNFFCKSKIAHNLFWKRQAFKDKE